MEIFSAIDALLGIALKYHQSASAVFFVLILSAFSFIIRWTYRLLTELKSTIKEMRYDVIPHLVTRAQLDKEIKQLVGRQNTISEDHRELKVSFAEFRGECRGRHSNGNGRYK